jgi:hypothetical protein
MQESAGYGQGGSEGAVTPAYYRPQCPIDCGLMRNANHTNNHCYRVDLVSKNNHGLLSLTEPSKPVGFFWSGKLNGAVDRTLGRQGRCGMPWLLWSLNIVSIETIVDIQTMNGRSSPYYLLDVSTKRPKTTEVAACMHACMRLQECTEGSYAGGTERQVESLYCRVQVVVCQDLWESSG